jgi:hypothetical protein
MLTSLVSVLRADPRRAFVVDGLGALVSTLALGGLLPLFADELGTTRSALYTLAAFPLLYAVFDLACVLLRPARWRAALRVVAVANTVYPLISVGVLASNGVELSMLGSVYFVQEIAIVWALAALELHVARAPSSPG